MSVRHRSAIAWEKKLRGVFADIDRKLESEYGDRYRLHPARPARGATARPAHDGLFNVGAAFSAGYGSKYGPGYVVEVRMLTLQEVPDDVRREIEDKVAASLRARLPRAFPGRELHVKRDGNAYKIYGDLALGDV